MVKNPFTNNNYFLAFNDKTNVVAGPGSTLSGIRMSSSGVAAVKMYLYTVTLNMHNLKQTVRLVNDTGYRRRYYFYEKLNYQGKVVIQDLAPNSDILIHYAKFGGFENDAVSSIKSSKY